MGEEGGVSGVGVLLPNSVNNISLIHPNILLCAPRLLTGVLSQAAWRVSQRCSERDNNYSNILLPAWQSFAPGRFFVARLIEFQSYGLAGPARRRLFYSCFPPLLMLKQVCSNW